MKVIVVGGGVIGLCCAWHLHQQGVEVEVLEGGEFGGGASGANAGWIVPSLSTPLAAPGMVRTGIRAHGLISSTGSKPAARIRSAPASRSQTTR